MCGIGGIVRLGERPLPDEAVAVKMREAMRYGDPVRHVSHRPGDANNGSLGYYRSEGRQATGDGLSGSCRGCGL